MGGDGGQLKALCDHCILVPTDNVQHIEELHLIVLHAIYSAIRDTCMASPAWCPSRAAAARDLDPPVSDQRSR